MSSDSAKFASSSLVSPLVSKQPTVDRPIRLGVMASGTGSNLEAIAQSIAQNDLDAQIQVLIYNNPDAKAADRADQWNIPKVLLNHRDYNDRESLDQAIVNTLRDYDVEWVVMAGWMRRVTQVLIDAFPDRILNIHPSLLPSFPGIRAIEQALDAKVKITGCTVHLVRLEVDSGPIIMQAAVPVLEDDTPETLHQRVQIQEHRIYPAAIGLAVRGNHLLETCKAIG